jgi:nucleoside-diphosphate-sugar epimerase
VLHVASPLSGDDMLTPAREGVRNVRSAAANAASPSSYTEAGVTDETLWTDPGDPTIIPYRRSKTVAEKAAWDFMASYDGPMTLATVLPGAVFGPILSRIRSARSRSSSAC